MINSQGVKSGRHVIEKYYVLNHDALGDAWTERAGFYFQLNSTLRKFVNRNCRNTVSEALFF